MSSCPAEAPWLRVTSRHWGFTQNVIPATERKIRQPCQSQSAEWRLQRKAHRPFISTYVPGRSWLSMPLDLGASVVSPRSWMPVCLTGWSWNSININGCLHCKDRFLLKLGLLKVLWQLSSCLPPLATQILLLLLLLKRIASHQTPLRTLHRSMISASICQ